MHHERLSTVNAEDSNVLYENVFLVFSLPLTVLDCWKSLTIGSEEKVTAIFENCHYFIIGKKKKEKKKGLYNVWASIYSKVPTCKLGNDVFMREICHEIVLWCLMIKNIKVKWYGYIIILSQHDAH